jgi:succinyl-CoA synthetase alpha subunit
MFSVSSKAASYDKTVKNMLINKQTKVVCQGFTGKQVNYRQALTLFFIRCISYGISPFGSR